MINYKDFIYEDPNTERQEMRQKALVDMNTWLDNQTPTILTVESISYTSGWATHYKVEGFRVFYYGMEKNTIQMT